MSTIRVDNFGPSAGGTTYSARGIAKAWVNFDGDSAGAAARNSLNVSSMTDNSTGYYTISFSNNFNTADYATAAGCGETSQGSTNYFTNCADYNTAYVDVAIYSAAANPTDRDTVTTIITGDLA